MEALLLTVVLVGLMVGALALLARTWPRSSRLGGYRAGRGAGRDAQAPGPEAAGVPEDDDARWHWPAGEKGGQDRDGRDGDDGPGGEDGGSSDRHTP